MGIVIAIRPRSAHLAPATVLKLKRSRSTLLPFARRASSKITKSSAGMNPRDFQLLCPGGLTPVSSVTPEGPPQASINASIVSTTMDPEYFTMCEDVKVHALEIVTNCEFRPNRVMSRSLKDIKNRLELTRDALGVSDAELCRQTGIAANSWSQFLSPNTKRRITLDAAYKLKDRYGVTLEWIYDGDLASLPGRISAKLPKKAA